MLEIFLQNMKHDPNYNYDDDEDGAMVSACSLYDMSKNELSTQHTSDDEDDDDQGDYSDSDDQSWKVHHLKSLTCRCFNLQQGPPCCHQVHLLVDCQQSSQVQ